MPAGKMFRCTSCKMVFSNPSLLQKHRDRFCLGGGTQDPRDWLYVRGRDSPDLIVVEEGPPAIWSPEDKVSNAWTPAAYT